MIVHRLIRPVISIWLVIVALIGAALSLGYLLPGGNQWLYSKAVDINNRRYFSIFIGDSDRQIEQQLTPHYSYNLQPSWSPDGQKIAYFSMVDDRFHVYIADFIGLNVRHFNFEFASTASAPIWSPNGQWILLSVSQMAAGESIILDTQTGETYQLPEYIGTGRWSPDSQFVFHQTASENGVDHLYGMNINCLAYIDSCQFNELDFLSDQTVYSVPEWSPDKQMIAFYTISENLNKVVIAQLRCSELTRNCIQRSDTIAENASNYSNPIWSPDGKQLAFVEGHYALKVYQVATGAIRSFDIPGIYPFLKDWSPNGKFIAYLSEQSGIANMYLLNLITGESRPLHPFLTSEFPEWRPLPR